MLLSLAGCATYHLTPQRLQEQLKAPPEGSYSVIAEKQFVFKQPVSNGIRQILCLDKNGRERTINVTKHTSLRLSIQNGIQRTYYFDTVFLKDSLLVGNPSRTIDIPLKPIELTDVEKVEIRK